MTLSYNEFSKMVFSGSKIGNLVGYLTPAQSRCFFPNNGQTLQQNPFKMAAIMADEEDGVKMDDRLIILKESLSLRRRVAAFGKLSMLEVFVTTGNA